IPLRPYDQNPPHSDNPYAPLWSLWDQYSSTKTEDDLLDLLHSYNNLVLWCAGHVHRNAITPQPSTDGVPEHAFWEVETSSLRDFPQQFRRFDLFFNTDNTLSIFALDVDVAVNTTPLADGSASPACTSRSYAVATQEIFQNAVQQGPNIDPQSGVYNAELVMPLSPEMQEKLANLTPIVRSFKINNGAVSTLSRAVTLNNTVVAGKPTHYMASESASFRGAVWLPYSSAPSFTLGPTSGAGCKAVYFKVKDGAGRQSAVVSASIRG
ncbi:MAG: hypothetical protein LLF99_07455, partial [Desulfobacteraceae bacterium]|nr:hypothetical protein [Desulfobacteraceae bacterium]